MAEELKQKFSEIQQKKAGKKADIQIDEFEWIQVRMGIETVDSENILKLNQELAMNRESGKKHQESANEKLMRKFKENPLIPIGKNRQTNNKCS